jgi:ubiquinone/menaquinone biosynthesis C-methylase UbiE
VTSSVPQLGVLQVLDLGCGNGRSWALSDLPESAEITGLDIARHPEYPASRKFVLGRGENLPFEDASFDAIVCSIALPYMDIPVALAECFRVLRPGGELRLTLHPFRFTWHEFREAFPRPMAMGYRMWVMVNGVYFHFTGRSFGESFHADRAPSRRIHQSMLLDSAREVRPQDEGSRAQTRNPAPSNPLVRQSIRERK